MKKFLLSAIGLSLSSVIMATTLSPDEALNRFLSSNKGMKMISTSDKIELMFTQKHEGNPMVYMFSRGSDKGFYAIAADDSTAPLLGFSDTGSLPESIDLLPDGMKYWIETLSEQAAINAKSGRTYSSPTSQSARWQIGPLCETRWNQSSPYNDLCPQSSDGKRSVTGCVATAMAQVMKYYNYPERVMAPHEYTTERLGQTLSIDESITFDWSNMLNKYTSNANDDEKTAVATLMRACGVSVDMNYSPSASGAVTKNAVNAFITNFGYDKGIEWHSRNYYTLSEWEDMMFDNLAKYGPILYSGQSNDGGHAFVCDGYLDGYFHFNWGWGGMSDGYFLMTALDPDSQGIGGSTSGYNFDQGAMTHVSKEQISESYFQQLVSFGENPISATFSRGETDTKVNINFSFINNTAYEITDFKIGIMAVNQYGSKTYSFYDYNLSLKPNYGYRSYKLTWTIPDSFPDGEYTLYPMWKSSDGNKEQIRYPVNQAGYIKFIKNGTEINIETQQVASITISDFNLESDLYLGSSFKSSAKLSNTSNESEYAGTLAIGLYDSSDNLVAIGNNSRVIIAAGETTDWLYISPLKIPQGASTPAAGNYSLYILESTGENSYRRISDPIEVVLHDAAAPTLEIKDLTVANDQIFWMMEATATVKCTQGYFSGTLPLYIFPRSGGSSLACFQSEYFSVAALNATMCGEKAAAKGEISVKWELPFYDGEPDTEYFARVYHNGSGISNYSIFRTSLNTEVENIEIDDAEIVETEYFTLTGISLGTRNPGKGIFIIRQRLSDGTITTKRIAQ